MTYRREPAPSRKPREAPSPSVSPSPWAAPTEALPVWLGPDGDLMIGLPPRAGEAGHSIRVSSRKPELCARVLLRILSDRAAAPFARIVEPGVPTQALADALTASLASGKRVIHAELRADKLEDADFLDA